jgi:hypothetical protein
VHELFHVIIRLRDRSRVEGVRFENVRAGLQILLVYLANDLRLREDQQVVVALDVVLEILETLSAIVGFGKIVGLDLRAHRAVEDKDARVESGFELAEAAGGHRVRLRRRRVLAPSG